MDWVIDELLQADLDLPSLSHFDDGSGGAVGQDVIQIASANAPADAFNDQTDYIDELDKLLSREEDLQPGDVCDRAEVEEEGDVEEEPPPLLLSPPPAYRDSDTTMMDAPPPSEQLPPLQAPSHQRLFKPILDIPPDAAVVTTAAAAPTAPPPPTTAPICNFTFSPIVCTPVTAAAASKPFPISALTTSSPTTTLLSARLQPQQQQQSLAHPVVQTPTATAAAAASQQQQRPFQLRNNLLVITPTRKRLMIPMSPPPLPVASSSTTAAANSAKMLKINHHSDTGLTISKGPAGVQQLCGDPSSAAIAAQLGVLKSSAPAAGGGGLTITHCGGPGNAGGGGSGGSNNQSVISSLLSRLQQPQPQVSAATVVSDSLSKQVLCGLSPSLTVTQVPPCEPPLPPPPQASPTPPPFQQPPPPMVAQALTPRFSMPPTPRPSSRFDCSDSGVESIDSLSPKDIPVSSPSSNLIDPAPSPGNNPPSEPKISRMSSAHQSLEAARPPFTALLTPAAPQSHCLPSSVHQFPSSTITVQSQCSSDLSATAASNHPVRAAGPTFTVKQQDKRQSILSSILSSVTGQHQPPQQQPHPPSELSSLLTAAGSSSQQDSVLADLLSDQQLPSREEPAASVLTSLLSTAPTPTKSSQLLTSLLENSNNNSQSTSLPSILSAAAADPPQLHQSVAVTTTESYNRSSNSIVAINPTSLDKKSVPEAEEEDDEVLRTEDEDSSYFLRSALEDFDRNLQMPPAASAGTSASLAFDQHLFNVMKPDNVPRHQQADPLDMDCSDVASSLDADLNWRLQQLESDLGKRSGAVDPSPPPKETTPAAPQGGGGDGKPHKRHKCPHCEAGFSTGSKLERHLVTHKETKEFKCPTCSREFLVEKNLLVHQKVHLGKRDHACGDCGKQYYTRSGLASHIKQNHSPPNDTNCGDELVEGSMFVCSKCPSDTAAKFGTRYELDAHRRQTHQQQVGGGEDSGSSLTKCPKCHQSFRNYQQLKRHAATQPDCDKPWKCHSCVGARFESHSELDRHVTSLHRPASNNKGSAAADADSDYQCQHCQRKFAFKNSLKKHLDKGRCQILKEQKSHKETSATTKPLSEQSLEEILDSMSPSPPPAQMAAALSVASSSSSTSAVVEQQYPTLLASLNAPPPPVQSQQQLQSDIAREWSDIQGKMVSMFN